MPRILPTVYPVDEGMILFFWKMGYDTFDIAKRMQAREYQIANRLWHLRGYNEGQHSGGIEPVSEVPGIW